VEIALGAARTLLYRVGGIVIWALIGVITARALSVEDRGTYASMVVLMFIVAAVSPGIAEAAGYFVSKRGYRPGEVMVAALLLAAGVSVVQFGALAAWGFVRWDDRTLIPIIGLGIFPQIARLALTSVFMGTGHLTRMALGAHGQAYWGLAAVVIWVLALDHRTAEDALGAFVAAQYVAVAAMLLLAEPGWRRDLLSGTSLATLRAMVGYGLLPGLTTLMTITNYRLAQLLVIRLDGAAGAGIYASAATIAEGLWLFSGSVSNAAFHRIGTLPPEEAARLTARTCRNMIPVIMVPAVAVAALAPWLIGGLYGARYEDGASALRILCLGTALFSPVSLLGTYFLVQLGRPALGLLVTAAGISVNVGLSLALVPAIGYTGAAWATLASYSTGLAIAVVLFTRLSGLPASELWRWRREDLDGYRSAFRRLTGREAAPAVAATRAS
jgi:O-antigen/teichoic acid export membrane protein